MKLKGSPMANLRSISFTCYETIIPPDNSLISILSQRVIHTNWKDKEVFLNKKIS